MIDLPQIILHSVVQGITEFLPISSSFHFYLISKLTLSDTVTSSHIFNVILHAGSLVALLIYYKTKVIGMCKDVLLYPKTKQATQYNELALKLVIGTLPLVVFGNFIKTNVDTLLTTSGIEDLGSFVQAINLIIFGIILGLSDKFGKKTLSSVNITVYLMLLIGLYQVLAVIPGVSRSGITITASFILGFNRKSSIEISFLLAIPALTGSLFLHAIKLFKSLELSLIHNLWFELGFAFSVTAIVGYLCVGLLIRLMSHMGMLPFTLYRVILGIGLLYYLA